MFAYLLGYSGEIELEKEVQRINRIYKSHRRVGENN